MTDLPKLTEKEEEVMGFIWNNGPMTVREIVESYPEPRPHFNTINTFVSFLEKKGYIVREKRGLASYYSATVPKEQYGTRTMKGILSRFFDNSYFSVVNSLVKDEAISVEQLKELVDMVERQQKGR